MSLVVSLNSAITFLSQLSLLDDFQADELAALARVTRFERYEPDQTIFYQGDLADRIWLVQAGRVKIVFHDTDGREVILELISEGEVFGGAVLFFPSHPATAKALEETVLASFSTDDYSNFLLKHPPTILKLLKMLGARHLSMINMQTMAGERVERRMAHILLKLAVRVGRETPEGQLITIPLSRQDLADMACTTLETAIRTVSRFQKEDLISTQRGGYILVKDLEALQKLTG